MPFITVNNIELYYEISGQGSRLLYISGTGADLRNKPNIFESPLADNFEILAFDQRGLGQSSRPDRRYPLYHERLCQRRRSLNPYTRLGTLQRGRRLLWWHGCSGARLTSL